MAAEARGTSSDHKVAVTQVFPLKGWPRAMAERAARSHLRQAADFHLVRKILGFTLVTTTLGVCYKTSQVCLGGGTMDLSALHSAVRAALSNQAPDEGVIAQLSAPERAAVRSWRRRLRKSSGQMNQGPVPNGDWQTVYRPQPES